MEEGRFAHGTGREEAHGFAVAQLFYGLAYAVDRYGAFVGVVAGPGIDSDEVGAHGADFIEYHVDHDLVLGPVACDQVDEGDTVERAEGMVADGDKRPFFKTGEYVFVVDAQLDFEIVNQHTLYKLGAGRVAATAMDGVDLVDRKKVKQPIDEFFVSVEARHQLAYVVVVQYVGTDVILTVI